MFACCSEIAFAAAKHERSGARTVRGRVLPNTPVGDCESGAGEAPGRESGGRNRRGAGQWNEIAAEPEIQEAVAGKAGDGRRVIEERGKREPSRCWGMKFGQRDLALRKRGSPQAYK